MTERNVLIGLFVAAQQINCVRNHEGEIVEVRSPRQAASTHRNLWPPMIQKFYFTVMKTAKAKFSFMGTSKKNEFVRV